MRRFFQSKVALVIVMVLVIAGILVACSDADPDSSSNSDLQGTKIDSNISRVKTGTPVMIPDITYEEAYEYFFENPQWRGFDADDGSEVVEFSGECTYNDEDATVYIQFVIDDEESFSIYYAELTVGDEKIDVEDQIFIELLYKPFATYSEDVLGEELSEDVKESFAEIYYSLEY